MKNKNVFKKLNKYAVLSASALAGTTANADVVYVDIDPDDTLTYANADQAAIDLDQNGIADFFFLAQGNSNSGWYFVRGIGSFTSYASIGNNINAFAGYSGSFLPYASALSAGASIGGSVNNWMTGTNSGIVNQAWFPSLYNGNLYGDFNNVQSKYAGVRFAITDTTNNDSTHYGWLRISTTTTAPNTIEMIIHDYAYEDSTAMPIIAGDFGGTYLPATNVVATDISDNENGSDIQFSFNAPSNDSIVDEYRAIIVKSVDAASFSALDAKSVSNYLTISAPLAPDTTFTGTFSSGTMDIDGDLITIDVDYNVFIFATNNTVDDFSLSEMSNVVTLNKYDGINDSNVKEISINNIGNTLSINNASNSTISVVSVDGKVLLDNHLKTNHETIQLDNFKSGMYIVNVSNGKDTKSKKIIL